MQKSYLRNPKQLVVNECLVKQPFFYGKDVDHHPTETTISKLLGFVLLVCLIYRFYHGNSQKNIAKLGEYVWSFFQPT